MSKFDVAAIITVDTSGAYGPVTAGMIRDGAAGALRGFRTQGVVVTAVSVTDVSEQEPEFTITQSDLDRKIQDAVAAALAAAQAPAGV